MRIPNPLDMVTNSEGKLVLTKLQAATFHASIAMAALYITWKSGTFNLDMWQLYAIASVGHHILDKGAAITAVRLGTRSPEPPPQA
jgi:hypothetical protein